MMKMKIKVPRGTKSYVNLTDLRALNPNLQVVKIRKKFRLIKKV